MADDLTMFPNKVTPRSNLVAHMPEGASVPPDLLRVPQHFHSVGDVLACADRMKLPNVLVLSQLDNGNVVFLDSGLTFAETNWVLDTMKIMLLTSKDPI